MGKAKAKAGGSADTRRKPPAPLSPVPAPVAKIAELDQALIRLVQERAALVLEAAKHRASPAQASLAADRCPPVASGRFCGRFRAAAAR